MAAKKAAKPPKIVLNKNALGSAKKDFANASRIGETRGTTVGNYGLAGQTRAGDMYGTSAMLQSAASGAVPSAAEAQLRTGLDKSVQNVASQVAAQGLNPALAARMSARAASDMSGAVNAQAAELRAQEQAQARGQLASLATNDAGMAQAVKLANQGAMNERLLEQAKINAALEGATISGKATTGAASIGANAQNYGTNVNAMLALTGRYGSTYQGGADAQGAYAGQSYQTPYTPAKNQSLGQAAQLATAYGGK